MTYQDIYTKFMIEYDKADVTSSYPSLTKYEAATILDKAYLALIARKVTGNNTRQAPFEYDIKAIEDIRPLITNRWIDDYTSSRCAENEFAFEVPNDLLYYIEGQIKYNQSASNAVDNKLHNNENVLLINHKLAQKFKSTNSNIPWIKTPVSFIEDEEIHILIDPFKHKDEGIVSFLATYIKKPAKFIDILCKDSYAVENSELNTKFELSDTMAEELINLAIIMALENVESSRLLSKLTTSLLES